MQSGVCINYFIRDKEVFIQDDVFLLLARFTGAGPFVVEKPI